MKHKLKHSLILLAMLLATAMSVSATESSDFGHSSLTIWEDAPPPAKIRNIKGSSIEEIKWDDWGLPIGNGRIGAVFYGSTAKEQIQFNESTLWTGTDKYSTNLWPEKGVPLKLNSDNYGSFQPFGTIELCFPHEKSSNYHRELDISRAVGTVTYQCNGVNYKREYFSSYPDQVVVICLSADRPGSYTGSVRLTDKHLAKFATEAGTVTARGRLDKRFSLLDDRRTVVMATEQQIASAKEKFVGNDMNYESQMRVIVEGETLKPGVLGEIQVDHADRVTILLAAGTDYLPDYSKNWRGEYPHGQVTQQLEVASKRPYTELLSRHIADYQSLFDRFQLNLGRSPQEKLVLPTDKRLALYKQLVESKNDPNDPELEALLAQYGRYLMISSSRPGHHSPPANLQGIWNPVLCQAAWASDFHMDINLEMNYWMVQPSNLSECALPLFDWFKSVEPVCERETQKMLGKPGWALSRGLNLFGGGNGKFSRVEGAWLCQSFYEYYTYTHDTNWLREVAFPIIQKATLFWQENLVEKNGVLLTTHIQSPEQGEFEDGTAYGQELVWELFSEYIEMADILGTDRAERDKIAALRDKLGKPKVGSWRQLMEWDEEQKLEHSDHRHNSHLVGLYPGRQISPLTTPDLAKGAALSLAERQRGPSQGSGWSKAFRACIWARLFNGTQALWDYRNLLKDNIEPDFLASAVGKENDKFQIDANFGATAAVCEMLMQSQLGELNLLPALPSAWSTGSVKGICGRNGFSVDMTWSQGKLTNAIIHSNLGLPCEVRYGDKVLNLAIGKGESIQLDGNLKPVNQNFSH
jgi:alpha-L-fucosidase 2